MNRHQRSEAKAARRRKRLANRRRTSDTRRETRYAAQREGRDRLLELGRTRKVPASTVPTVAAPRLRFKPTTARRKAVQAA